MGIAVHPDGSTVYVTAGSFGHLFFVDPSKKSSSTRSKPVSGRGASALLPGGTTIVTANGPSNDVSFIDLATKAVKKVSVGSGPGALPSSVADARLKPSRSGIQT